MIFTVRKRPLQGIPKNMRSRQAAKGAIYVPSNLINTRVKVMTMKEYWEMKKKAELFETIQKFTEKPWVVR